MCKKLIYLVSFSLVLGLVGSAPAALPQGWMSQDIGTTGGSADESGGTWTISGDGADIWGSSDAFHYAYVPLSGDGTIVARVLDNGTGSDSWAKGGVMIRETLEPGSKHAMMFITGGEGNGRAFQCRPRTGGSSYSSHGHPPTSAPPSWVALVRKGNFITGYYSEDSVDWIQQPNGTGLDMTPNPVEIDMAQDVYIGVFVTSHAPGEVRTYTFDNVSKGRIIYVDKGANGANDGTSWANAYRCLQDALAVAPPGGEIRVAQGTYKPDQRVMITAQGSEVRSSGDRTETFQLKNGMIIKGGYAGFDEPDPDARDIKLYETILSGDLNDDDGPNFAKNDENSYHVVSVIDNLADNILDGFLITGGNANSSDDDSRGGGMFNSFAGVIVTNCTFMQNSANEDGGAVYNEDCFAVGFINCLFVNNIAGLYGGAVSNNNILVIVFENCVFTGNSANEEAGAIDNWYSMVGVLNCTFSNNSAGVDAGGLNSWFGLLGLKNCILWKNRDNNGLNTDEWAQIFSVFDEPLVNYCCIEGLTGRLGGEGNIRANPDFVDPDGPDRVAGTKDDNLRLSVDSPCIDAGDNSAVPGDLADFDGDGDFEELYPYDFDGLPRCIDDPDTVDTGIGIPPIVDMGAYEFGGATPPPPSPSPTGSLAEALDTDLSFTTGGSVDWFAQTTTTRYDGDAAQSGDISRRQDSWMQTTVSGAGTIKFYWKVSSEEDFDFLEFYIDSSLQEKISGLEDEWEQQTYTISTSGSHTLEWRYVKDGSGNEGSDCGWVDKVEW